MKRIAFLLFGLFLGCLPLARISMSGAPPAPPAAAKHLTIDDMVHPENLLAPGISSLQWRPSAVGSMPDANHSQPASGARKIPTVVRQLTFVRPEAANPDASTLCEYDLETHRTSVLLNPAGRKEKFDLGSYQWSPRGGSILLPGENDLWLLNHDTKELRRLTRDGVVKEVPTFSPSGDRIAFIKQHDLYVVDVATGVMRRLTHDGSDTIYNGLLDWVYGEELANRSTARAYEWSPDGKQIAYLRLDDRPVPEYPITDFHPTHVTLIRERFPQPGDANPVPSLHVVAVDEPTANPAVIKLDPQQVEYFGPSFTWMPDGTAVCFLSLNRDQTEETLHRWAPRAGTDRALLAEHDPYWVNALEPPRFIQGGREFLWVSERDGWQHVYLYTAEGKLIRQITQGRWMLDRPAFEDAPLFQLDPQENWLYFTSTHPDPRERQLYRIHLDGSGMERLTADPGAHTLDLSPDGRYLVDSFSTVDAPPVDRLLNSNGALAATIDAPANHLSDYDLGKVDFVDLKAADGTPLYAELLKPANFDPAKKYPVIVDVYGGPHIQMVQKHWDHRRIFAQLLAANGFLVWQLDNRGSWGRGHAFESVI